MDCESEVQQKKLSTGVIQFISRSFEPNSCCSLDFDVHTMSANLHEKLLARVDKIHLTEIIS